MVIQKQSGSVACVGCSDDPDELATAPIIETLSLGGFVFWPDGRSQRSKKLSWVSPELLQEQPP